MVSTRGLKLRFVEGERVLCYEPDPTKAKVLYDSKVLDIVINKDHRGRKSIEYLIHFQGWNSSWDRCVGEEYVLKDTAENRQLQKDLAEKAQLQLGAYLYRKERKKNQKPGDRVSASEDGSSSSPGRMDTDDGHGITTSSEDDSSTEDETIYIELTEDLRKIIENDYYLIKEKHKVMKLPAEPNVATILESYYRHYATNQICGLTEKLTVRYRTPSVNQNQTKPKTDDIQRNLSICREVLDGLRIYFDYTLNDLLLYKEEVGQVITKQAVFEPFCEETKQELKQEEDLNNSNNMNNGNYLNQNGDDSGKINARRRTLRSNRSDSQINGNASPQENNCNNNVPKPAPSVSSSNSDITGPLSKTLSWKILPDHIYHQQPPPPCLVYGATHLTRLFVKLPELLTNTTIPEEKLKVLLSHFDVLIEYLNDHKEWYGEQHYIDVI